MTQIIALWMGVSCSQEIYYDITEKTINSKNIRILENFMFLGFIH